MDGIRVSYILSTKDRCAHLERTLANIREFITPADELIVVDGASRDATREVVQSHRDVVTQFVSEPDDGEAHGFNKALLLARGELVKPLTDDDYTYADAMRTAVAALTGEPTLDALICGGEQIEEMGGGASRVRHYFHLPAGQVLNLPWVVRVGCGIGLVFRRSVVARVGLFDPAYLLTDIDYIARLVASRCRLRYLNVKLFRHTVAAHSLSRGIEKRDRDWLRLSLRAGDWPDVLNVRPFEALCEAVGVRPGHRDAVLLRTLRDLAWLHRRLPLLALILAAFIRGARAILHGSGRFARRLVRRDRAPSMPPEPTWDGLLR